MAAARTRAALLVSSEVDSEFFLASLDDAPEIVLAATRDLIERESTVAPFLARYVERSDDLHDYVTLRELSDLYKSFCKAEEAIPEKKKYLKQQLISALGPMSPKSNGQSNYWRGWRLLPLADPLDEPSGEA
jgi:hypothetical protein